MKPTHPFSPPSNSKIVPPHIPALRKESFEEENARLKAEVEKIRKTVDEHLTPIPEHTTVREVERLCVAWSLMSNSLDAQWKRIEQLKDEVERLRKAGDAMAEECENFQGTWKLLDAWKQAKEGKPSV